MPGVISVSLVNKQKKRSNVFENPCILVIHNSVELAFFFDPLRNSRYMSDRKYLV